MAKRKSSDDEPYEPKLRKLEEDETSEQLESVDSKGKRVRKKSAKLLEMEEYEVFEKKMLKSTPKSSSVNNTKTSPKKNKMTSLNTSPMSGLDNLASVAAAELTSGPHPTKPCVKEPHIAEPLVTKPVVVEKEVPKVARSESVVPGAPVIPSPVEKSGNSMKKLQKVKPLKLKNISTGAPSLSAKTDITPKLKPPKPKPSFEDQLMGPDNAVVQTTPKKKRPKKAKPHKEKPPERAESPSLSSPPAPVTVTAPAPAPANFTIKQENSGLKMKLCWDDQKADILDSDLKSDEDQPAIWPSQIQDERDGRVLVKLKKKKSKKNKLDGDREPLKTENKDNCIVDKVTSSVVNDSKPSIVQATDHVGSQEGQLQIDLDRKKEGKSAKRKKLKKHKKESIVPKQPAIKPELDEKAEEAEHLDEGDESGVYPVNIYSNTEVMAMKLKTSREKKASICTPKQKEKRFRRRGPTAYTLFSNAYRTKVLAENPGIDFAQISKRLGEIWQCLPAKEKMVWKRKAKQRVNKIKKLNNSTNPDSNLNEMVFTSKVPSLFRKPGTSVPSRHLSKKMMSKPVTARRPIKLAKIKREVEDESASSTLLGQLLTSHIPEQTSPQRDDIPLQNVDDTVPCNPIDVAAHLKLLGDSLQTIGFRLQDHRGPIAVQGSLSVLLDSALCAMGSLMCLTKQLHDLQPISSKIHSKNLDNIAYIMPGIG